MTFPCLHCEHADGHTNAGALFCWSCHDLLSDEGKDTAIDIYLQRQALLERAKEQAAA